MSAPSCMYGINHLKCWAFGYTDSPDEMIKLPTYLPALCEPEDKNEWVYSRVLKVGQCYSLDKAQAGAARLSDNKQHWTVTGEWPVLLRRPLRATPLRTRENGWLFLNMGEGWKEWVGGLLTCMEGFQGLCTWAGIPERLVGSAGPDGKAAATETKGRSYSKVKANVNLLLFFGIVFLEAQFAAQHIRKNSIGWQFKIWIRVLPGHTARAGCLPCRALEGWWTCKKLLGG